MSNLKVNAIEDNGAGQVTFNDNVLISASTFTSRGIDDNATGIQLTISQTDGEHVKVANDLEVVTDLAVGGAAAVTGALSCASFTSTGIDDNAAGALAIVIDGNEDVTMNQDLAVGGTLGVTGLSTLSGGITAGGVSAFATATASGNMTVSGQVVATPGAALVISSSAITVTASVHTVEVEGDIGAITTDDLTTINGGTEGAILVISCVHIDREVVVKDGTGNLLLAGDFSMDHTDDRLVLIYSGSNWVELSRSTNA